MKTKLSLLSFLLALAVTVNAQDYKNSIGIRLGGGYYDAIGASFKTFLSQPGALELNLAIRPYGNTVYNRTNVSFSGAYQHHFPIANIEGFKWFVGGGAILSNTFSNYNDHRGFNMGIFPTGGVDYKLKNAPFAFSADVRPTIHVVSGYRHINNFYANGGVTARYTF
jgi:hypothetical protein